MKISGFIGKPGVSRATRASQRVFINGRAVENAVVNGALREGYHTALMKGRYPVAYLFLDMDPAAVDVNVHPAKREVRFREPGAVREALVAAVRRTLEAGRAEWTRSFHQPPLPDASRTAPCPARRTCRCAGAANGGRRPRHRPASRSRPGRAVPGDGARPHGDLPRSRRFRAPTERRNARNHPARRERGQFNVLGVLGRLYVLMENKDGLVLVDQHAAHERILFEELRRRLEANDTLSQQLLFPLTLQMNPKDADWLRRHLEPLQRMGIGLEEFGPGAFKLDSLPPFLQVEEPLPLVREIIDALQTAGAGTSKLRLGEEMIAKTVCRHAVKANDRLRERELVDCSTICWPASCPTAARTGGRR